MEHDEIVRLDGRWRERTPADAAELFRDYPGRWWIAGGWAIEAFTGTPRPHSDLDPSLPRPDAALVRRHLASRLDVWAADGGVLRPLVGEQAEPLPPTCHNLWLRASGTDPWEYDVLLESATSSTWTYRRDARITRAVDDILCARDGIEYLRPEIQLLYKAKGLRPKDQADFDACVPLLESGDRDWLRAALELAHPGHPWIRRL